MKVLLVHLSSLMYAKVYPRLEPMGLERVAEACREVRLLNLQVFKHKYYHSILRTWQTEAVVHKDFCHHVAFLLRRTSAC